MSKDNLKQEPTQMSDKVIEWSLYFAVVALFAGILWLVVVICRAEGRPDYCYIDTNTYVPGAILTEHRPWRPDKPIQVVKDADEAARAAQAIGCSLH